MFKKLSNVISEGSSFTILSIMLIFAIFGIKGSEIVTIVTNYMNSVPGLFSNSFAFCQSLPIFTQAILFALVLMVMLNLSIKMLKIFIKSLNSLIEKIKIYINTRYGKKAYIICKISINLFISVLIILYYIVLNLVM